MNLQARLASLGVRLKDEFVKLSNYEEVDYIHERELVQQQYDEIVFLRMQLRGEKELVSKLLEDFAQLRSDLEDLYAKHTQLLNKLDKIIVRTQ